MIIDKTNKHYKNYLKQKQKLQDDLHPCVCAFPHGRKKVPYTKEQQQLYRGYIKRVADLMFETEGNFQMWLWDMMTDEQKRVMEVRSRPSKYEQKY